MLCEAQIVRESSLLQVVPISIVQISEGESLFGFSPILSVPTCFLSLISAFSQIQPVYPSDPCLQ